MASGDTAGSDTSTGVLSSELLKSTSNEFDIESIHTISLSRRDLNDISVISGCIGLERLDLSHNAISKLYSLSTLTNLLTLDLSSNNISTLDGLQSLDKLQRLDLSGNYIGSVDELRPLKTLECLMHLRLHNSVRGVSNPLCMRQNYKSDICGYLPRLETVDGEVVRGPNAEVFEMLTQIDEDLSSRSSVSQDTTRHKVSLPADLPDSMFSIDRTSEDFTCQAEFSYREELAACKSLNSRGDDLIKQANLKLKTREKV